MQIPDANRIWRSFSAVGLLTGTLFFAASLTPSLVPRPTAVQGVVSGVSLSAGYAIGVFVRWLWGYLELPHPQPRTERWLLLLAAAGCAVVAVVFLLQASEWQNSVRMLMGIERVDTARPLSVGLLALLLFGAVLVLAKAFRLTFTALSRKLKRFVPRRVSYAIGVLMAVALFWSLIEGVLFSYLLRAADTSFQQFDALMEADVAPPADPAGTGGPDSLLSWDELGRAGREFVTSGPTAAELSAFLGGEALAPIRVYVGRNSAETVEQRARLALDELLRVGAFERSVLVIVTPTGTGWVDPGALDTVEMLHRGDIASVAVQYSYLPSALSLLVEPQYGADTASAVFSEIYRYWTELPPDARPRLYLHGLSLGALNSDRSFDIFDIISDPFDGALWSGPPFRSDTWRSVTARRIPGTPAWLPRFRDSSIIRFMNQYEGLEVPGTPWGALRIVFLQYASDPITFFEPEALYREPAWMRTPRGPDVSPELRWYPVVTFLQLAADMLVGGGAPQGHGHDFAPEHYIDAWIAVTEPPGWSAEEVDRLKRYFGAGPQ
jgi:uncharacterized membrane protein